MNASGAAVEGEDEADVLLAFLARVAVALLMMKSGDEEGEREGSIDDDMAMTITIASSMFYKSNMRSCYPDTRSNRFIIKIHQSPWIYPMVI